MAFKVSSHGAARTVTGSCHLVETDSGHSQLLLDCGQFQGSQQLEALNHQPFAFKPEMIEALVLSHAHLDHAGRLPKLVREGFKGPIYASRATRALAEPLLLDAAKLQQEDFERNQRKGHQTTQPLFNEEDVTQTLARFKDLPETENNSLNINGTKVFSQITGHIPGARSLILENGGQRLVFSGDLGNSRKEVLPDAPNCPQADLVLCESTYGDRDHKPYNQSVEELAQVLRQASESGGKILIPSFALERTQDLLFQIARLEERGEIPKLPVFVDSPLASKVQKVYETCQDEFSPEVQKIFRDGKDPFQTSNLKWIASVDESKALNSFQGSCVILAGAGMLTGGRIIHHLKLNISNPNTHLVFVGFQPEGGLGRLLVEGANHVKIQGEDVRVRGQIHTINGFSAHADQTELLQWLSGAGKSAQVRLVHGEISTMQKFQVAIAAKGQHAALQEPAYALPEGGKKTDGE